MKYYVSLVLCSLTVEVVNLFDRDKNFEKKKMATIFLKFPEKSMVIK